MKSPIKKAKEDNQYEWYIVNIPERQWLSLVEIIIFPHLIMTINIRDTSCDWEIGRSLQDMCFICLKRDKEADSRIVTLAEGYKLLADCKVSVLTLAMACVLFWVVGTL